MSGVATSWRVAWSWPRTFHDAWPHSLAAASSVVTSVMPGRNTLTELVSRTTWRPWSPQRPVSWASPWTTATDLDALAAGVRQPGRQRDRADLGHLVQAHQQRRVQAAGRRGLAHLRGDVVDLGGHGGEQRGDRGLFGDGFGDHVQGAGVAEEGGDVEPGAGGGQDRGGQGRVGHEGQGPGHDHSDGGGGLVCLGAELRQDVTPTGGRRRRPGSVRGRRGRRRRPRRRRRAGRSGPGRRRGSSRAGSRWLWRTRRCRLRRPSGRRRTRTRRRGGSRWPGPRSRRSGTSRRWTGTPPMCWGLKTWTGPSSARTALVRA